MFLNGRYSSRFPAKIDFNQFEFRDQSSADLVNDLWRTLSKLTSLFALISLIISPAIVASEKIGVDLMSGGAVLGIPPKHIVTSFNSSNSIILLDLFPFSEQLKSTSGKKAKSIVVSTAKHYVRIYGSAEENESVNKITVMLVYVKDMDEYNRPDYPGMIRHGTLAFERAADSTFSLVEDKLVLNLAH